MIQILLALEKKIEEIMGHSINIKSCFDWIGGTSAGGIIAAGIVASAYYLNHLNHFFCLDLCDFTIP